MPLSGGLGSFRKNALSSPEVAYESVGVTFYFHPQGWPNGPNRLKTARRSHEICI
jgi:hypothetical protein